jgi:uncharacterized metal-binding protein YceD (DUF177 family)
MDHPLPKLPTSPLRLADLSGRATRDFLLEPDANARAAIAAELGIIGIRKLRFAGTISPDGKRDWHLAGDLGASVVQECVITLDPVTTRIDEKVIRRYLADLEEVTAAEVEMPEDDTAEPLPDVIDLYAIAVEALSLALPPFPRADGAELGQIVHAGKGVTPLTDEAARPFAGLQSLRDKLGKSEE